MLWVFRKEELGKKGLLTTQDGEKKGRLLWIAVGRLVGREHCCFRGLRCRGWMFRWMSRYSSCGLHCGMRTTFCT